MEHRVRIHKGIETLERTAVHGEKLLDFLNKNHIDIDSPCGGNGKCGKCRIRVNGFTGKLSTKEKNMLGKKAVAKGYRLACYNKINDDADIFPDGADQDAGGKGEGSTAKIIKEGIERQVKFEPAIIKKYSELKVPDINDQGSDIDRVLSNRRKQGICDSIGVIREMPDILRSNDFKVTGVYMHKRLIAVEPGDTTGRLYGIAVDIGTTTIAAYLYDLSTGKRFGVYSLLNPQRRFGADVLTRIDYTNNSQKALDEMNRTVIDCINLMIKHFIDVKKIKRNDIYSVVFVGNTTMMHFLMKVSARNIALSPFIPVTTLLYELKAAELNININHHGYVTVFPSVSAYIGADTVAAVLSSGMHMKDGISLLIDIGTNGEIVLGNNKRLLSCSTAAGPAFEGANIRNGMGGVSGAIDSIRFNDTIEYTTIDNKKAAGICGSGIVDAISGMLAGNIIDETGRIAGNGMDMIKSADIRSRIVDIDGCKAVLILKSGEGASDTDIAVTQKDIRELQNAKAAIAAGIKTLIKRAGIVIGEIEKIYLAGGFGSYINIDSALRIGLLPEELRGRIESIGNAAGAGAVLGLLSVKMLQKSKDIKKMIEYVELSASPDFADEYVENMIFPVKV